MYNHFDREKAKNKNILARALGTKSCYARKMKYEIKNATNTRNAECWITFINTHTHKINYLSNLFPNGHNTNRAHIISSSTQTDKQNRIQPAISHIVRMSAQLCSFRKRSLLDARIFMFTVVASNPHATASQCPAEWRDGDGVKAYPAAAHPTMVGV